MKNKTIAITFGRFNPPTIGHGVLIDKVMNVPEADEHRIFLSQTQDEKRNPLSFEQKIKWMKQMYPKTNISTDSSLRNIFDVLVKLLDEQFFDVIMVVGSDRVASFENTIRPFMEHSDPLKKLWLTTFEVRSAGQRDPDSDDVSGMSASKLRSFAMENEFGKFIQGLPKTLTEKQAFELFNDVRVGLKLPRIVYK